MARIARAMQCVDVARWADLTANVEGPQVKDAQSTVLERHQPQAFHLPADGSDIVCAGPGVVLLAHQLRDHKFVLLDAVHAKINSGDVATKLLQQRARAGQSDYFVYIKPVKTFREGMEIQSEFQAACGEIAST